MSKDSGLFEDVDDVHSWWSRYQPKVWKSLEEPYTSFWAKVRKLTLLDVDNEARGKYSTVRKGKVLVERNIFSVRCFLMEKMDVMFKIRSFREALSAFCMK